MDSEQKTSGKNISQKKSKTRVLKLVLMIIAVLAVLLFFLTPVYLSSSSGTNMIVGKINNAIDGQVKMGDLSVGWLKGVELTDVSFVDDAGTTSVNIKKVSANPSYIALLRGKVDLGKTIIDNPEIVLTIDRPVETGIAVTETDPEPSQEPAESEGISLDRLALEIKDGNVTISMKDASDQMQSVKFSNIESKLEINPAGDESSFDVAMDVDGKDGHSTINANGVMTPDKKKKWRPKEGSSGKFIVKINDLELASLRPLFALAGKDIEAQGKLNADIDANIADGKLEKLTAQAVLEDFKQVVGGKETALTEPVTVDAEISSLDDAIRIDKLTFTSSFCQVDCNGDAEKMQYTAIADLEKVQDFAGQMVDFGIYKLKGDLYANGNVMFGNTGITSKGKMSIGGLTVANADTKKSTPQTNAELSYDIAADKENTLLTIASLDVKARPGIESIKVSNSMIPLADSTKDKLLLSITTAADLGELLSFAEPFEVVPDDMEIAGKLQSNLTVSGNTKAMRIATDNTSITDIMIKQTGKEEVFEDKRANLILDMILDLEDWTYEINDLRLDSQHIDIPEGWITQNKTDGRTEIEGKFVLAYDHAELSKIAGPFLPAKLTLEGKRESTITFNTQYKDSKDLIANMNASAGFGFDKANYMGMLVGKTDLELSITKGLLVLNPIAVPVNEGILNLKGSIDFNEETPMLKIAGPITIIDNININDEMSKEMLKYVNPLFANQYNVNGIMKFNAKSIAIPLGTGKQNEIEVLGTVELNKVKLNPTGLLGQIKQLSGLSRDDLITIKPTPIALQNGVLRYEKDMQVLIGSTPLFFGGSIGLNKALNMTVKAPASVSGTKFTIPVPLEGTVDDPQINIEKAIQQTIGSVLEGQLGGLFGGKEDEEKKTQGDQKKEVEQTEDQRQEAEKKEEDIEDILKKEGIKILQDIFK